MIAIDPETGLDRYQAPYHLIAGTNRHVLIIAEHASNAVPPELRDLGLGADALSDHIAFDPGVRLVVQALLQRWQCSAVLGGVSRLVADLNRSESSPSLILAESDGIAVPGNQAVDQRERERRVAAYHRPYHQAIASEIDQRSALGIEPQIVSVHSFTPVLEGFSRPWQIGVLWQRDPERHARVLAALNDRRHIVGDNEPYDGRTAMGYSLETHGVQRGLWHIMFELRNDLIRTEAGAAFWAGEIDHVLRSELNLKFHQAV
ncbi:N-formylglutamate amidohydrolase [Ahniella affigens]|uniref:N-formylglutamate amidohydrolase n=1 Tax=Ahniella affigens TaxID=2021234 RepID=A0A2P1PU72_9GAMM|nr:N-formylglutamate amidohydrolase [Ahniella affigens]AVP98381.1 N-formylglutamate amidohydrolase [Ahniella affigens]